MQAIGIKRNASNDFTSIEIDFDCESEGIDDTR
jgi:hypothetical protein